MEEHKVSVIIPVYNGQDYIQETIQHILQGSYQNLEIITVIDGCHDNSQKICQKMAEKDERIRVFYKENGGIAKARNYGIVQATGTYIAFCDQDDIVEPKMYENLVQTMDATAAEIGVCSCGKHVEGSVIPLEQFDDRILEGCEVWEELLFPIIFSGYKVPVSMTTNNRYPNIWKSLIRRDFWEEQKLSFHAYVSFEDDFLMMVRILSVAKKVCTVSYMGYLWRVNMASESHARKYIEEIGRKQRLWVQDVCESVALSDMSEEQKHLVEQVTSCRMYVDAVLNLCSPYRKEPLGQISKYFEDNIYCMEFEDAIDAWRYTERKFPMQYVILRTLRKKHTYRSYFAAKTLVFLVDRVYQSKLLMKIDSLMKGK